MQNKIFNRIILALCILGVTSSLNGYLDRLINNTDGRFYSLGCLTINLFLSILWAITIIKED